MFTEYVHLHVYYRVKCIIVGNNNLQMSCAHITHTHTNKRHLVKIQRNSSNA